MSNQEPDAEGPEYLRQIPHLSDELLNLLDTNEDKGLPIFTADRRRIEAEINRITRLIRLHRSAEEKHLAECAATSLECIEQNQSGRPPVVQNLQGAKE